MTLGGGYRNGVPCLVFTFVVLLGCYAPQCHSTAIFDTPPKGNNRDLPAIATAFVQTGNELHYFSDVQYHEDLIGGAPVKSADDSEPMLNNQLQFNPTELSFGEQALGVPFQQKVFVRNPTASTVRFDAISGSTIHFHCSFPEHKIVDPEEETSFDVVFLPRQEGAIENVLFVHSSLGTFTYSVRGYGSGNPYRIRPLVGAKVPLNGTFVSAVQLYNPHSTTLLVKAVYTSGGDVHLELPDTAPDKEHVKSLWEIAPYQTKTIMNAKLLAAKERNATSYIRIKTGLRGRMSDAKESNRSTIYNESFESTLIVPVEVEVTRKRGLFATVDVLDFGLVRIGERTARPLMFEVVSTLDKGIEIESLYVAEKGTDDPSGIYMEFASKPPIAVKCGARQQPGAPKAIARVTFDSKLVRVPVGTTYLRYRGKITAESRSGNYNISVPYVATMYSGTLIPDVEDTTFLTYINPPASHAVTLKNTLPFGVTIWNVTIDENGKDVFLVKLLTRVVVLLPGESRSVFWLRYLKKKPDGFTAYVTLRTNVTTFNVPVSVHDGKLKVSLYSIDQTQFDFGLMNMSEMKTILFAVTNKNPMPVTIKLLKRGLPSLTSLTLKGMEAGSKLVLSEGEKKNWSDEWSSDMPFTIAGRSFAVFNYTLTSPRDNLLLRDTFVIESDFQTLTYPVKYGIEEGTVTPVTERLSFPNSFPFKVGFQSLKLYSTFKRDMRVLRLSTLSRDSRLHFEMLSPDEMPVLKSNQVSDLGRVQLKPNATCGETNSCYLGINLNSGEGQWFTYGMKLPQNLAEIDTYLYKRLRKRWLAMRAQGKHLINETIIVDTDEVKHIPVSVTGELVWPRLLTRSVVHFPLTAVGNFTIMNLTLHNPASTSVVVQLLPLVIYPDAENLVEFFRDILDSPLTDPIEMNETLMFSLRDTELFTLKPDSPVPMLREQLQEVVGQQIPKFTLSMLLRPGMKVRIRVGFLPNDYTLRSSLLLIRNNLTVLEPVVLYGKGSRIDMRVDNRSARSSHPLTFDIMKHHLTDCYNPRRLTHKLYTTLTVKRSFTIVNTGEVSFTVVNMSISYLPCMHRGFRILNCHPFRLAPNETHVLDVAYTPDFLMTWNEADLQFYMHMNSTAWTFPLGASIPFEMLPKCHAALPRPNVEWLVYYVTIALLFLLLICAGAWAYLDGERTVEEALHQQYTRSMRVFDLNAIEMNGKAAGASRLQSDDEVSGLPQQQCVSVHSDESNILSKVFWDMAQAFLWVFSQLWLFRRLRINSLAIKNNRNRRPKQPGLKSSRDNSAPSQETKEGLKVTDNVVNFAISVSHSKRNSNKNGKIFPEMNGAAAYPASNVSSQVTNQKVIKLDVRTVKSKGTGNFSPPVRLNNHQALTRTKTGEAAAQVNQTRTNSQSAETPANNEKQRTSESGSDASRNSPALASASDDKEKKKGKTPTSEPIEKNRAQRGSISKQVNSKTNVENVEPSNDNNNQQQKSVTTKNVATETKKVKVERKPVSKPIRNLKGPFRGGSEIAGALIRKSSPTESRFDQIFPSEQLLSKTDQIRDWVNSESAFDERSETGYSDTSGPPEWADESANALQLGGNVDEEFAALSNETSHFANVELDALSTAPLGIPTKSNQQSKRNPRKKQLVASKSGDTSSRSTSLSSAEGLTSSKLDPFLPQFQNNRFLHEGAGAGVIGSRYTAERPDGRKPSSLIQELQKERRQEEEEHRRKKAPLEEESWPGFNLELPVLQDFFFSERVMGDNLDSTWQPETTQLSRWPPTPASSYTPPLLDVKESVVRFRLNPAAPAFQPSNNAVQQRQRTVSGAGTSDGFSIPSPRMVPSPPLTTSSPVALSPTLELSPLLEPTTSLANSSLASSLPTSTLCEGLLNDPLGYSGSLFHDSRNIWAANATDSATSEYDSSGINPVLWAGKFLAEQDELDLPKDG